MKYLKYLLGIILLLALIFIAIGFISPSNSYESEIVVNKPLKEAWSVMQDPAKAKLWLKGIKNIEHVSGRQGEVGAVTKYTFVENGQESIIVETIKSVVPDKSIAMDFVMEGVMVMDYEIEFEESAGKTKIKSATTTTGQGMIMRSMMPLLKGTMKAQEDENLSNLKKVIEENTKRY